MSTLKKFELMEKIARELESLHNTQQAVLERIGKIEVDNIELGDKLLESKLPDVYQRTADNSDSIQEIIESFKEKTEAFGAKHNVDKLKQQDEIDSVK